MGRYSDSGRLGRPGQLGEFETLAEILPTTFAFSIVDMGPITFYLGLKADRNQDKRTIKLSQPAYIDKILYKFYLNQANPSNTPIKESIIMQPRTESQATVAEIKKYQQMTGSLMFLMVEMRPDIAFAMALVAHFSKNLSHQHTKAIKTILKYLKGFRERGITYGGTSEEALKIQGYSDFDWAGDKESRKSTSGYIFMLNVGPVS